MEEIILTGLRYGKVKLQAEQMVNYINDKKLSECKITIVDSQSKQKLDNIKAFLEEKIKKYENDNRSLNMNNGTYYPDDKKRALNKNNNVIKIYQEILEYIEKENNQ